MIDEEKFQGKVDVVDRNLRKLDGLDFSELEDDFWMQQAVKHTLQEVIEACIDIANHIIASQGFERPDEYRGYFRVLGDEGVIERDLADRLGDMAGFRNILVHRYADVDMDKVHSILRNDLTDVEDFVAQVHDWVQREGA